MLFWRFIIPIGLYECFMSTRIDLGLFLLTEKEKVEGRQGRIATFSLTIQNHSASKWERWMRPLQCKVCPFPFKCDHLQTIGHKKLSNTECNYCHTFSPYNSVKSHVTLYPDFLTEPWIFLILGILNHAKIIWEMKRDKLIFHSFRSDS